MDAKQRWQRVAAILEAALEVSDDGRAAFVREACAGDAELHAELVGLLAAHARSGRFLDRSALALVGDTSAPTVPVARPGDAPRFAAGQTVGRYRIQHLVGAGGMGEVYAADELEHGRRVALKVMKGHLPSAEGRERFLDEGRLASAVNHPNCVYVFGSEIVDGQPVIVMELVEGGTLKDLVQSAGPMPAADAVDAILQVIAGAEAAHAGGILHRDIKPANCFVDRDGTVKLGDFGVSVATGAELTRYLPASAIQVTPQYAAPEQLKGAAPDVRADIYAVGATLFYLLAGRAPFDDQDLLALLTRIQTDTPPSPRALVPGVPRGLAAAVLRCLAKHPGARYPTYAALRGELLPFRSGDSVTVPVGGRLAAAAVDQVAVLLMTSAINMLAIAIGAPLPSSRARSLLLYPTWMAVYFLATEAFGSASVGKRLFGLCVVDEEGGRPRPRQVAIRTAIFACAAVLPYVPTLEFWVRVLGPAELPPFYERAALFGRISMIISVAGRLAPLVLFVTARPGNRWAGLHERLSGTRVARAAADERTVPVAGVASRPPAPPTAFPASGRRGPFVLGPAIPTPSGVTMWQALDPVLQRDVWVRDLPPGSSISSPERRRLARPGRLRWLGGQAGAAAWEAFEAPRGAPLSRAASSPRPWAMVRRWLADLAGELAACEESGEPMTFTRDHVWITDSGRAILLDFPAPGTPPARRVGTDAVPSDPARRLLGDVARAALPATAGFLNGGERIELPLPPAGMALFRALREPRGVRAGEVHQLARHALAGATAVPRWSRVVPAMAMLIPLAMMTLFLSRIPGPPLLLGVGSLDAALVNALMRIDTFERAGIAPTDPRRESLEVYVARRYEGLAARAASFGGFLAPYRSLAEEIAGRYPVSRTGELESALARIGRDELDALNRPPQVRVPIPLLLPLLALPLVAGVGLASVALAVVLRGGALWTLLRLVVVDAAGHRVTRVRAGVRALVAWAPAFALLPMRHHVVRAVMAGDVDGRVIVAVLLVVLIAIVGVVALVQPARGVQERLSGTWITPA